VAKTREEMWASCESVGKQQAESWVLGQSVRGVELGYVKQWIQYIAEKEEQQIYNINVLKEAKKANRTAWIAALASVVSALTALAAVTIGK
jgi:hypothetical protein